MMNEHPEGLLHRGCFRKSLTGRSDEPPLVQAGLQVSGASAFAFSGFNFQTHKDRWMELLALVHQEYPYCTMYGVHVIEGSITACEQIQRSLLIGNDQRAPSEIRPDLFDMKWQALEALCLKIGNGRLVELKFHDAKPVIAITKEGGRRFKGILKKLTKA